MALLVLRAVGQAGDDVSGYEVTFERVGRNRNVPPLTVAAHDNPDVIAGDIYYYARKFLASSDVEVTVDLEMMRGSINYGRFGTFTLAEVSSD